MNPNSRLPISIENDGLADAVVALGYKPVYSREVMEEKLIQTLNKRMKPEFQFVPAPQNEANKRANITRFIANQEFRIQFSENMVMTNVVGHYSGWKNYSDLLQLIMHELEGVSYQVAYVRYVSLFDNISIFDYLEGDGLQIKTLPNFMGTEFNFRCKVDDMSHSNVVATVRLTNNKQWEDRNASVVDILVEAKLPSGGTEVAWDYINYLHYHEKNLFFLMMKEEFVNQHNPSYE